MEVMDNSNGVGGSGAIVVVESAQQKLSSAFMKVYVEWYENFYGKPFQFPVFNKRFFDVEKLWYEVEAHGGSAQVCLSKNWAEIGRKFDPPQYVTNLSTIVKGIYERYLLEYEPDGLGALALEVVGQCEEDVDLDRWYRCGGLLLGWLRPIQREGRLALVP
eukprot:TRINITY_DN23402_c0_g2_i2.p1 TRINITY_DN23402_c0_g2~~TRINITY_DN23402_c0_g2_i2.p1  ORF type:complete len:184 (+),score=27.20 TRINITY_DN23402_c0_g2_i2:72-554(+)